MFLTQIYSQSYTLDYQAENNFHFADFVSSVRAIQNIFKTLKKSVGFKQFSDILNVLYFTSYSHNQLTNNRQ